MRYREALAEGTAALEKAGIETARLDAWYLLEHVCHITRQYFYLNDTDELKKKKNSRNTNLRLESGQSVCRYNILSGNRNLWD